MRRSSLALALALALVPLGLPSPASASSTANEVVYAHDVDGDGAYALVLRDLGTRRLTTVLPADTSNGWYYDDPELSPDGTRVAVATDRGSGEGGEEAIAVVGRDGSGFRRVTSPTTTQSGTTVVQEQDVAPAWSPDGTTVVFTRLVFRTTGAGTTSEATAVSGSLWTVRPGTTGTPTATAVPGGEEGFTADWDPSGTRLVFAEGLDEDLGTGTLTVMGVDGSGKRSLGTDGALPAWSPDGTTIAYTAITGVDPNRDNAADIAQIATVPAAGGAPTVLAATRPDTARRSVAEYPTWSPDGESILYDFYFNGAGGSGFDEAGDLWAVDRAGVRAGRVTSGGGDETQPFVHGPAPASTSGRTPSNYVALAPKRVFDTRPAPDNVGVVAGRVGPGETRQLPLRGQHGVPADATAVVLNVTVTAASGQTDVRVYPSGAGVPEVSNLNAVRGTTAANLVTVALGTDGAVTLRNAASEVHLLADLAGYYLPVSGSGTGFTPVAPARVLDTRAGLGAARAKVGPGGTVDLDVTGALPTADGGTVTVPADVRAVVLSLTATDLGPDAAGRPVGTDVRAYPAPATDGTGDVPLVSNLNLRSGQTVPNLVVVAVDPGTGAVRLRNAAGSLNLIADLAGWYSPSSTQRFVPAATPIRLLDTRDGTGAAPIPTTARAHVDLRVRGTRGVPATASAVLANLTGVGSSSTTDVRAYPSDAAAVPTVSNLNLARGEIRAALAVMRPGADGRVRIRNEGGQLHLLADLAGWFQPS